MTDREKICREFHEACGGHWHEWALDVERGVYCIICDKLQFTYSANPQYLHPDEVLREVMKWDDWGDFLWEIGGSDAEPFDMLIGVSYILEPDKLLIAAHKWVTERKVAR